MGFFLRNFPRWRRRRAATWLALVALLLQAAVAGFHLPAAQAAGHPPHHASADCPAPDSDGATDPAAPAQAREHCPFCLQLQGAKLLPPAVCLVFPPAAIARQLGPPPSDLTPAASEPPSAHWPRGPPRPA
jgi:hypothetical protein